MVYSALAPFRDLTHQADKVERLLFAEKLVQPA
jgi:hypothetical protein